jgi:hypothetical protein
MNAKWCLIFATHLVAIRRQNVSQQVVVVVVVVVVAAAAVGYRWAVATHRRLMKL